MTQPLPPEATGRPREPDGTGERSLPNGSREPVETEQRGAAYSLRGFKRQGVKWRLLDQSGGGRGRGHALRAAGALRGRPSQRDERKPLRAPRKATATRCRLKARAAETKGAEHNLQTQAGLQRAGAKPRRAPKPPAPAQAPQAAAANGHYLDKFQISISPYLD